MITFLYGTYGSGKTTAILDNIKNDTDRNLHTFLIVPEQEAVQSERTTLISLPNSAQLNLEVLSFSRLYNRVCREYGDLSYRYITKPIRHLLMWQNLRELADSLEEYNGYSEKDTSLCDVFLSAISECKFSGITPTDLENAAKKLPADSSLSKRLRDVSKVYAWYDSLVSQNYSDSSDDISRLYKTLKKNDFFSGANVYIDSFTSFTGAEHRVIERIFADADNVTVTIPLPSPDHDDISTKSIRESLERLKHSANKHGGYRNIVLDGNKRAKSEVLAHICEKLWQLDVSDDSQKVENDGSVTMEICNSAYAEAEAVSNQILELLRRGERCRDMLVLMRSPENYKGIIEPAFEKNAIPYFFSEKSDLNDLPPIKLLLSALRIKQYNWQRKDVIAHLKTGIYDIPERSVDLFEEYVNTWKINGSRLFLGEPWSMNPDGYTKDRSDRGDEILLAANSVKEELTSILEKFFILLDAADTLPDMCRAVYSYFLDISLEERLSALAAAEAERGNIKEAKEMSAVYGIILESLSDIATALPDISVSTEEFILILRTVFDNTDIGTIPTSVDEVVVGSAATVRASNPKYTFVLGLCEGEFPAAVNDSGLFSFYDREELAKLDIELSSNADTRSSDELMYAQKAFSTPSHGLYLYTHTAKPDGSRTNPSIPFSRVKALLRDYTPHKYSGNDIRYLVGAPRSAVAHVRTLGNTVDGETLKNALDPYFKGFKDRLAMPISARENLYVTAEAIELTQGKSKDFSSSKFEKYVNCPMSYYCTYELSLREKVDSDFLSSDMGNFVHAILEHLIKFATTPDENGILPTDEEILTRTEDEVLAYINLVSPRELINSKRLEHIYTRLKNQAILMVRNIAAEFKKSEFIPKFFELPVNGQGANPKKLEIVLEDGFKATFKGKIDRVDVYKNGNDTYVRIIDYKTGAKVFSLDDVEHGINTQMLLYLFMLCRSENKEFCKLLDIPENEAPKPAGIMYLSASLPVLQTEAKTDRETVEKLAEDSLKRSGLLLSDIDVLKAMNSDLSKKFLAGVYQKKDGSLSGSALTSADEFKELYNEITETVTDVIFKLHEGHAGAFPLRYKKDSNPCDWCKMKAVCRRDEV